MIPPFIPKFLAIFKFKEVGLGIIILLLQLFLYFNANVLFSSNYVATAQETILVYILLQISVISISGVRPSTATNDARENIWNFLLMFIVSAMILVAIPLFLDTLFSVQDSSFAFTLALIQAVVVAYPEELVFRGILPKVFGNELIPAMLFGVFHFAVSGMNPWFMLFAFGSSFVFSAVKQKFGVLGSAGVHTAWNLKQYGVLDLLFKGLV
jgi:membrane protease YdiL (CAAX protease family)